MSTTAPAKSGPTPDPDPTALASGPPEEEFWERYNPRLEFPLSAVTTILIHVLVAAILIGILSRLMNQEADKSSVPMKLMDVNGLEDEGGGMSGSGGIPDPIKTGDPDPFKENLHAPDPSQIPDIKEKIRDAMRLEDPSGDLPIADANAEKYIALDKDFAKKMLGTGAKKGAGPGAGTGSDGSTGAGPGGTGANSSRARSLRWVLRFRVNGNGEDYVAQLGALGAVILVPLPPDSKQCLLVPDLKNPTNHKMATDEEVQALVAGQIKFGDTRPDSVQGVCGVLGVKEPARSFWAFFPKGIETELSSKEIGYRNRRPEDIEETIFRVIVRGGTYEIVVDDQTAKR